MVLCVDRVFVLRAAWTIDCQARMAAQPRRTRQLTAAHSNRFSSTVATHPAAEKGTTTQLIVLNVKSIIA
jgi:hypothetical protein